MGSDRDTYERGRRFVLHHARPLDHARWCFLFENGSPQAVLTQLSAYQNSDGGFGHALEPDFWNPLSSPMQTWAATEILQSLDHHDPNHPIVRGILGYLEATLDPESLTWSRTVGSNNDFPHAPWWSHPGPDQPDSVPTYNPTAALAGFVLRYADRGSRLWERGRRAATRAFAALVGSTSVEVHELSCFVRLHQCALRYETDLGVDLGPVGQALDTQVNGALTRDTSRWATDYVCRPSRFLRGPGDRWVRGNEDLVRSECQFLKQTQLDDGSWPVTWQWSSFPDEWAVAKQWWKSALVIENLQFLRAMEGL